VFALHLPPVVSVLQPPLCGTRSHLAFATLPLPIPSVAFLKLTVSSRLLAPPSGSPKCLRFGLWLTLCTLNILFTYLLTVDDILTSCRLMFRWFQFMEKFDEVKSLSSAQKNDLSSRGSSSTSTPSPRSNTNTSHPLQVGNDLSTCRRTLNEILLLTIYHEMHLTVWISCSCSIIGRTNEVSVHRLR